MDTTKNYNYDTSNIINSQFFKLLLITLGIIFSFIGAKVLGLYEKADAITINSVLFTGFFFLIFLILKCKDNKIIPYFLLQFISLWIFINQDFFARAGLSLKPHAAIFGFCLLITIYYVFTNFKYLWASNSFKFLFFFLLLNLFYALFYSSDFRSSSYIDTWIQGNVGLRNASIGSGFAAVTREFGSEETRFLKYLTGLLPLVSFTIGYMALYGLKTIKETKQKIGEIIKLFSFSYLAFFVILVIGVLIGTVSLMFIQNRLTLDAGFTGNDFEGLIFLLFISFHIYITKFNPELSKNWLKYIIVFDMVVLSLLIILGIKKGTILSFTAGVIVMIVSSFFFKKDKSKTKEITRSEKNIISMLFLALSPLILFLPVFLINQDIVSNALFNIFDRFTTTDTLEVRSVNWYYYLKSWGENLSPFTAVFGFGTDASREAIFFLSAMHPDKSFQQPHIHNIYLEYFYNWGLMALLYFLPPLIIMCKDVMNILKKSVHDIVKLFSAVSLASIIFFFIYYSAESPAMPTNIVFFALLGFLESAKLAFLKFGDKDLNDYAEASKPA